MYKTVIFDFDGTIADTFSIFCNTLRKLSEDFGQKELTEEDIKAYRAKGAKALIKDFKILPWRIPFLIKKGQVLFQEKIQEAEPFPQIPEILYKLAESNNKLGVLTTNSRKNVQIFLKKHNLEVFAFIVSVPSLFSKSRTIRSTFKKYNLKCKEVIYVGDELRDIENAKKAGVDVVAVTWGYNNKELLVRGNPDFIIEKPKELLNILQD
ncbi:MAG: HAD-IA family hydrolase [Patescibacteria group bacterium]|nr:HAD-IA family hydrolase [Patescibacteria group bacterium]